MRKEENINSVFLSDGIQQASPDTPQESVRFSRHTYTNLRAHISTFVMSFARQSSWQLRHTPPMIRVATIHAHLLIQAHLRRCQAVTHFKAAHSIPSASHFNWMRVIHMTNVGCLPPCMCTYVWVCLCGRESQIRSASVSASLVEMSSLVAHG